MDKSLLEYLRDAKDEVVGFCKRCMTSHRGACGALGVTLTLMVGIPFADAVKDGTPQSRFEWTWPASSSATSSHLEIAQASTIQDGVEHGGASPLVWYKISQTPGEKERMAQKAVSFNLEIRAHEAAASFNEALAKDKSRS